MVDPAVARHFGDAASRYSRLRGLGPLGWVRSREQKAVRELTDGKMVDFCVEAAHLGRALVDAALLPRRQGRLCVFGVSYQDHDAFPWNFTTANETQIVVTRGTGWMDYAQLAIDRLNGDWAALLDLVTPRLPWDRAQEAFEMYAYPADHEGSLKVVLDL